jgi:two-component system, NtrC family, response regulator AtoC
MNDTIIVIDDEQDFLETARRGLITSGFRNVRLESDPRKALALFERGESIALALIDISMPFLNGVEVLEAIKSIRPATECIMVTAMNEARMAVECLKKGAYDYLVKPVSREDLVSAIDRALERRRLLDILDMRKGDGVPKLQHPEAFSPIITTSANVIKILKEAELHAPSKVPILITGESGTGKELLARAIHLASPRARFPFSAINMASPAGSTGLFDAEFFGHTKGAFTGAEKERMGHLQRSDRGTLFLDEIGILPPEFQGKLLRVLQDGEFTRLGSDRSQKVDIRLITATNEDLTRLMAKGAFRKDLYYRLRGAWLHLPPLRERRSDIPVLIERFLGEFASVAGTGGIDEETINLLLDYDYPGNIRELRSIIQSAVNLAQGKPLSPNFLPDDLRRKQHVRNQTTRAGSKPPVSLAEVEKAHILKAYHATGRNKALTARMLGIGLSTLRRKLEVYGEE